MLSTAVNSTSRTDRASLSLDPNKKPRTWGAGLLWACGQYWTRTSDLYHVKVAL